MSSYSTSPTRAVARRRPRARVGSSNFGMLVVFLAITLILAGLAVAATRDAIYGWYLRAPHVQWTPGNTTFVVAWTMVDVLAGVAGWLVWRQRRRADVAPALALFAAQLVLNALWYLMFFGGYPLIGPRVLWLALAVILIVDLTLGAATSMFWSLSKTASLLLVPAFAWILFVTTLNIGDAALIALN